jgi:transcriptional regulator EpsA
VAIIETRRTIISTQLNSQVSINNNDGLSLEQRIVFMDVISESLRVSQRKHLFNWLQGAFQSLVGHEIMLFGIKSAEDEPYYFEYFTSCRYFGETQFNAVIEQNAGLVSQVIKIWKKSTLPVYVNNQDKPMQNGNYSVINFDQNILIDSELKNFVLHGFGHNHSKLSSIVIFARLHKQANTDYAQMLELIMPHLHCALIRVTSNNDNESAATDNLGRLITKRELEVMQWLYLGKTNWEISTILEISPLTVKNHVQNLIRKLNVLNRSQAAVKAAKLGLIKMLK